MTRASEETKDCHEIVLVVSDSSVGLGEGASLSRLYSGLWLPVWSESVVLIDRLMFEEEVLVSEIAVSEFGGHHEITNVDLGGIGS